MSDNWNSTVVSQPVRKISSDYRYDHCIDKCLNSRRYFLTPQELSSLQFLRLKASIRFDSQNLTHIDTLKELWRLIFQEEPDNILNERWVDAGFQSRDAGQDFRGAGMMGLQQLIYVGNQYPSEFRRLLDTSDYPFAISSINITVRTTQHFLIFYFQLNNSEHMHPDYRLAPARVLKNFCIMNVVHERVIDELYVYMLFRTHEEWAKLKARNESIMNFKRAIMSASNLLERLLRIEEEDLFNRIVSNNKL